MEVASVADSRRVVKLCYYNKNNNIASNLKLWFANKNDPRGNAECLRLGERERERLRLAIKLQLPTFVPLDIVEAQMKSEVNLINITGVFY